MIMKYICTFCFICFSGLLLDTYNCLIFCPLDYYLYVVSLLYFTFNYVSLDGKFIGSCLSILPVCVCPLELNPFLFKVVTNQEVLLPVVSQSPLYCISISFSLSMLFKLFSLGIKGTLLQSPYPFNLNSIQKCLSFLTPPVHC